MREKSLAPWIAFFGFAGLASLPTWAADAEPVQGSAWTLRMNADWIHTKSCTSVRGTRKQTLQSRKIGFPGTLVFKQDGRFEMSFADVGGVIAGSYQQTGDTVTLGPDTESLILSGLNHYPGGAIFVQRITRYAPGKWKLLPKKKKYHFEAKIFAPGGVHRALSISENRIYAFVKSEGAETCTTRLSLNADAFGDRAGD